MNIDDMKIAHVACGPNSRKGYNSFHYHLRKPDREIFEEFRQILNIGHIEYTAEKGVYLLTTPGRNGFYLGMNEVYPHSFFARSFTILDKQKEPNVQVKWFMREPEEKIDIATAYLPTHH